MRKPLLGTEHRNSTLIIRDGSDADQLLRNDDEDESGGEREAKGGDGKTFLMEDYRPQASWMTLIAFWICGTVNNFGYVVMLSAADDLLQGTSISPPVVLFANILPGFIAQLVCPWFQDLIPYSVRIAGTVSCGVASFLVAALIRNVYWRLFGVVIGSIASAFGEMTFLAYSSSFHKNTVSAWSSGTGAAGVLGAFVYWLLTSQIKLSYESTLLVSSWVPAVNMALFLFCLRRPATPIVVRPALASTAINNTASVFATVEPPAAYMSGPLPTVDESDDGLATRSGPASAYWTPSDASERAQSAKYVPLRDSETITASSGRHSSAPSSSSVRLNDPLYGDTMQGVPSAWLLDDRSASQQQEAEAISLSRRLRLLVRLMPYALPLAGVYFFEYLINQSVDAAMRFSKTAWIHCGSQYTFLQLVYQIGVFISRSSVNFVRLRSLFSLQLPAIFQAINAIVLSFSVVYGFIPSLWIVVAIVLWEGLLGGSIYVNCFYLLSERFRGRDKEFCLGALSQAYGGSITLAAVAGYFLVDFLKEHAAVKVCVD